MSANARKYLAVCEKTPKDAVKLNYDPRNPFDLCSLTYTPVYRYANHLNPCTHGGCSYMQAEKESCLTGSACLTAFFPTVQDKAVAVRLIYMQGRAQGVSSMFNSIINPAWLMANAPTGSMCHASPGC